MTFFKKTPPLALLICALVISFGIYLRFYALGVSSYWMDEGYTVLALHTMLSTGAATLPGGMTYPCGLYCIFSLPFAHFLSLSAFSVRLVAVISSILSVGAVYKLTCVLFSRHTAYIASIFMSLSYWQIAWARQARWYSLLELFSILTLYTYVVALRDRSRVYALLTALLSLCAIATHYSAILLPVVLSVHFVCIHARKNRVFSRQMTRSFVTLPLVMLPVLLISLYGLYAFARSFDAINLFSYYWSFYGPRYAFYGILALFALLHALYTQKKRSEVFLLFAVFTSYLVGLSFFTNILHYRYLFLVTPCLYILAAFGSFSLYEAMVTVKSYRSRIILFTLLFVSGVSYVVLTPEWGGATLRQSSFYALESDSVDKKSNTEYYAYTPQPDWAAAYAAIQASSTSESVIISSHPHFTYLFTGTPGYWIPVDYIDTDDSAPLQKIDPYVGALPVDSLDGLITFTSTHRGFIVFDYQASNDRIPEDMLVYIRNNYTLMYEKNTNPYSHIWVYAF